MAKITSRASLNIGTELTLDTTGRTIKLNVAGNLVAKDGCSIQALYSKLVDLWSTTSYQDFPFPMYTIDYLSGQFQFGFDGQNYNGWTLLDATGSLTRQYLRDGGWTEYTSAGVITSIYVGVVSLGVVDTGAQLYYQTASTSSPTNFAFTDAVNQGVLVYNPASSLDNRTYLKGFCRESGYLYSSSVLSDTGKTASGAYIVDLLLSNSLDLKITAADAAMTSAPYASITITYYATNQSRTINGTAYNFNVIVAGNGATLEQIYTKIQYLLRQTTGINSGTGANASTVIGKTAAALMSFSGSNLTTTTGVYIDNIQTVDTNRITFVDVNGASHVNPYTSLGTLGFNSLLIGSGSLYQLFFTTQYGTAAAVTVKDASGNSITGIITASSIAFTFPYDSDTLGGAVSTDKAVTLVGIRAGYGQYAVATGTITRSGAISLSLVAPADRAYQ